MVYRDVRDIWGAFFEILVYLWGGIQLSDRSVEVKRSSNLVLPKIQDLVIQEHVYGPVMPRYLQTELKIGLDSTPNQLDGFIITPVGNNFRFRKLFKVAKLVLPIPHLNAGIERVYSLVIKNKSEESEITGMDIYTRWAHIRSVTLHNYLAGQSSASTSTLLDKGSLSTSTLLDKGSSSSTLWDKALYLKASTITLLDKGSSFTSTQLHKVLHLQAPCWTKLFIYKHLQRPCWTKLFISKRLQLPCWTKALHLLAPIAQSSSSTSTLLDKALHLQTSTKTLLDKALYLQASTITLLDKGSSFTSTQLHKALHLQTSTNTLLDKGSSSTRTLLDKGSSSTRTLLDKALFYKHPAGQSSFLQAPC
ncbi:hypothetical protein GQR58_003126 [Nymphon striatum]|nr:hypothetical protein GQR58_003126 [Nymphon striatum]